METLAYAPAPQAVFAFFLLFCRIGGAFMTLPAIGEQYFLARSRLAFALLCSLAVYGAFQTRAMPAPPPSAIDGLLLMLGEAASGVLIGMIVRVFHSVAHITGMIVSYQAGLTAAMMFDPSQSSSGSEIGNFLGLLVVMLLFATDMHHLFIRAAAQSYDVLPLGGLTSEQGGRAIGALPEVMARAFSVAVGLGMPFMAMGLVGYLVLGVMGRLMPQMQVFFVVVPLQILLILSALALVLSSGMLWLMERYEELLGETLG
jgi:flagellar biosynthetic protein FliR